VANVVVSALATWNGKALKKAKQDVDVFSKQIKQFARVFGVAFSATALVAFSKKAVKAFAEDEAAAKSLALQLENTGNAFRVTEVEAYIKGLEKTYAILTDLRAPFKTLLNVTGSVDLAQRSLEAALDISAGTGENLATVVGAIAAGVRGQTKAINGLNTGIDKNILATGDMNKIMAELEKKFSGQAAARLDTYAGKMDVLKKGADEATKSIGTGLVDALVILSKDQSISGLSTDFENLGDNIAFATVEMAKLIKKFTDLVQNPSFKAGLLALAILSKKPAAVLGAFGVIGVDAIGGLATSKRPINEKENSALARIRILNARIEAKLAGAKKKEYDLLTAKNAIENKNVEELKKKFDLERIGINAALNSATDEETKLRLKAQLAILDNNEALAKKFLAEMEAAEALKALKDASDILGKTFGILAGAAMDSADKFAKINPLAGTYYGETGRDMPSMLSTPPIPSLSNLPSGLPPAITNPLAGTYYGETGRDLPSNLRITVDTATTGDKFAQLIAESLQVASRSGYSSVPNGSLPV